MKHSSKKQRKGRSCARNGRKTMVGGVVTQQWTVGDRIPGVNNYAQVNKVFSDCDYKGAPQVSVTPSGLPGFSVADAPSSFLSSLKFWGGKRTGRKTMKKGKKGKKHMKKVGGYPGEEFVNSLLGNGTKEEETPVPAKPVANVPMNKKVNNIPIAPLPNVPATKPTPAGPVENVPMSGNNQKKVNNIPIAPLPNVPATKPNVPATKPKQGGAGGLAYGPSFEVIGPNPVRFETRLGCESGAAGPQPHMMQAADTSILSKLKFWGGKKTRKTRKNMKGGSAPFASAFDIQAVRGSPYTLTPPGGNLYEVPQTGFGIVAPLGGNNAGQPPYDQVVGYPSAPVLAGACMKGGKRRTHRKSKKHGKRRSH